MPQGELQDRDWTVDEAIEFLDGATYSDVSVRENHRDDWDITVSGRDGMMSAEEMDAINLVAKTTRVFGGRRAIRVNIRL